MDRRTDTPGNPPECNRPVARPRFLPRSPLYAIVDAAYTDDAAMPGSCAALIKGGAGVVQLRAKSRAPEEIARLGSLLLPLCRAAGVPFIINDYPGVAAAIGADGVHIGQDDGTLAQTRALIGPDKIIGRSTHSPDQAFAADAEGFDYIGFGPLFPTGTKPGRPAIGLDAIALVNARVSCPVFCIGGINPATLPQVRAAGARHIVMVSALLQAPDIAQAARDALGNIS